MPQFANYALPEAAHIDPIHLLQGGIRYTIKALSDAQRSPVMPAQADDIMKCMKMGGYRFDEETLRELVVKEINYFLEG